MLDNKKNMKILLGNQLQVQVEILARLCGLEVEIHRAERKM